jgi:hypothetical protein
VAGNIRVPRPAAVITAFRTRMGFSLTREVVLVAEVDSVKRIK